jgi:hypothetical protein
VEFKQSYSSSSTAADSNLIQKAGSSNSFAVDGTRPLTDRGDLDMRIARDGTWFYRRSPIARLPLVKLFASVLRREPDGRYWLVTPAERCRIEVEDVPFLAVALAVEGEGREQQLIFRTNLDDIVTAGPDHPLRVETAASGAPAPYILVRDNLEAKIGRPVFYDLVELGGRSRSRTPPNLGYGAGASFSGWANPARTESDGESGNGQSYDA